MEKVYSDDCMTRWFTRFKNAREYLIGDLRSGRPEASNVLSWWKKSVKLLVTIDIILRECWLRY